MFAFEIDVNADDYKDYCEEYARRHPIYELGMIVGHEYPGGLIVEVDDYEDPDDMFG